MPVRKRNIASKLNKKFGSSKRRRARTIKTASKKQARTLRKQTETQADSKRIALGETALEIDVFETQVYEEPVGGSEES